MTVMRNELEQSTFVRKTGGQGIHSFVRTDVSQSEHSTIALEKRHGWICQGSSKGFYAVPRNVLRGWFAL